MRRVVIIHGYRGSPDEAWRPWLTQELEKKGMTVRIPAMPGGEHPRVDAWTKKIEEEVGTPDTQCTLVGHSLGCISILRYLEGLSEGQRVGAVILIAGFFQDLGKGYEEIRNFTQQPIDWNAIRTRASSFAVIHSNDDDRVPVPFAASLAEHLHVPLEMLSGYGHFSARNGIMQIPEILKKFAQ